MKQTTQQIFNEATQLPPIERAELVERIIESFDAEPDEEIKKGLGRRGGTASGPLSKRRLKNAV